MSFLDALEHSLEVETASPPWRTSENFGVAGSPGTRLLAGPGASSGAESLASHERRLGPVDLALTSPAELRDVVRASNLLGRGGAGFPTATKLDVAASSPGTPLVVVNASEGEPASRKDRTLLELRPHLVLDGAELAAFAVGAPEIIVYSHRSRLRANAALEHALDERRDAGRLHARIRIVDAPARYVSGETSAVVSFLGGHGALPRRGAKPAAQIGVANRPTVVNNAETLSHLALIARFGAPWFARAGTPAAPGSVLLTLAGSVTSPGLVVEILEPVSMGLVLADLGGVVAPPRAVLLGGYAGNWIPGDAAWNTPLDRHQLLANGTPLGCGLIAVLHHEVCGLVESARVLRWLASESSGQCGPCVFGLPMLSSLLDDVVAGRARRGDVRRLRHYAAAVRGRGACAHPTGAVALLESALDTFAAELASHRRGAVCTARHARDHFPLPHESDEPR